MAIWTRLFRSSLVSSRDTYVLTVATLMNVCCAISALEQPRASASATSRSRSVRASSRRRASARRPLGSSVAAVTCAISCRVTLGDRVAGASATVVTLALAAVGTLIAEWAGGAGGWSLRWSYVGNSALVLALSVLMGMAFGMALLNSALAIVVYLVLPTLWTVLGAIIPALGRAAEWLDTTVTMANMFGPEVTAGTWARLAVSVAVWVALPLAIGLVRVTRQEVA